VKKVEELKGTLKKFSGESASNVGQCVWGGAFQAAPAFCTSFRSILCRAISTALKTKSHLMPQNVAVNMKKVYNELTTLGSTQSAMCLISMAVDQLPLFRGARDSASVLLCQKPAVINSEFLPALKQNPKMGTTSEDSKNSTLFLDMSPKEVAKTIKKNAFSGGGATLEEHKLYGGNVSTDICYQYLTFFLESDEELKKIAEDYTQGTLGSGDLKKITADLVAAEIEAHQRKKAAITEEYLKMFFNVDRDLDIGGVYDREELDVTNDSYKDYDNYGINFDRTFGVKRKTVPVQHQTQAPVQASNNA